MANIQRKDAESGFQASELKPTGSQSASSGLESGIGGQQPVQARPAQAAQAPLPRANERVEAPAEAAPKKRYYSPREVMQKRGCIGCGGMTLVLPVLFVVLAAVVAF